MRKSVYKLIAFVLIGCIILCSCSFTMSEQSSNQNNYDTLSVHYLDVGQGDSIFIELPGGSSMLIDAGVSRLGKSIKGYINSLGYNKIDYLVATHPHADHIGSMAYIVDNMNIGEIYMPKVSANTKTYEKLLESISAKGLKIKAAAAGADILDTEQISVCIAAPVKIDDDELNNCSVVIKIQFENTSFLFTGDAEKEELKDITADISADVLKVGHHGSRTSTSTKFLTKVNPKIAVISLGRDNDYGHPHKSTIKCLNNIGAEIYRTDKDRTIIVTSDGQNISVETGAVSMERDE